MELGYESINTSHFLFTEEPVILAMHVHQVFYLEDSKNGTNWKVVPDVQNKCIWDVPEVNDVENEQLNVLKIVVEHRVGEYIEDDTLCRPNVDPTVVKRPIVRHVTRTS
ncbi:uncharacterized protein E6C27_scaffold403G00400 [Cucumis melo var. makuwa]|uniref:DUF4216 domain-containing protein n=1 Tax=Cucumis melo var. makuwa TaxID=1194695 RepID=A0A5A7T2S8_CUCMM|nr:uncharacterized protein E6C27_scaffold403G00400 [Cucumis melo var. makuwa]